MSEKRLKNAVRRAVFGLFYSHGDTYHCVFCGKSYSRFLPIGADRPLFRKLDVVGAGRRENARCPNCFSKDRSRLLYLFLRHRTDLFDGPRCVLHVAPEEHVAEELVRSGRIRYLCGGHQTAQIKRFNPLQFDIRAIPFADESFDALICNHVIGYVPEDLQALGEMRRTLRPGGFAIVQTPIALACASTYEIDGVGRDRRDTREHYGHAYNVRIYGRDYEARLRQAGFTVETHNAFTERWVPDIEKHGVDPREDIYVCFKR